MWSYRKCLYSVSQQSITFLLLEPIKLPSLWTRHTNNSNNFLTFPSLFPPNAFRNSIMPNHLTYNQPSSVFQHISHVFGFFLLVFCFNSQDWLNELKVLLYNRHTGGFLCRYVSSDSDGVLFKHHFWSQIFRVKQKLSEGRFGKCTKAVVVEALRKHKHAEWVFQNVLEISEPALWLLNNNPQRILYWSSFCCSSRPLVWLQLCYLWMWV